ncbi:S1C family serine protease [Herbiconiux daphne]|uniref:S1C family serine protease n=1 Tax=Herbiconiux daphne TaxID=2970914 RepID=UPI002877C97E|nr:trypsin-like peptidase domain-containing protein [Herbiconiux daphne]
MDGSHRVSQAHPRPLFQGLTMIDFSEAPAGSPSQPAPAASSAFTRPGSRRRRTGLIAGVAGLALVAALGASGTAAFATTQAASALAGTGTGDSSAVTDVTGGLPSTGYSFGSGSGVTPYGYGYGSGSGSSSPYGYGYGSGGSGSSGSGSSGSASGSTATDAVPATAAQTSGVVTIDTVLAYQNAAAAGTGIILTSDGLILTNNHVVEGSTSIQVTDESTGEAYTATVVGTDATHDVALLQLQNAEGLTPASIESADPATTGDAVTAVGNAEGTGDLVAASGTVVATDQPVTTQAEGSVAGETLTGMLQVDADIVSGDSGGPLLDADGDVVGIDTAASSGSAQIVGFAIPIATALDIAAQIEQGQETDTIEIGYPGFLGIQVASNATVAGAGVAGVIDGTPAADAGLAAGDVITAVNGTAVTSGSQLSAVLGAMEPREQVSLSWTTSAGSAASATVTLVDGPAA